MLTVRRSATGESWQEIMMACSDRHSVWCDSASDAAGQHCGSHVAYPFFISFYTLCSFLVSSLSVISRLRRHAYKFCFWETVSFRTNWSDWTCRSSSWQTVPAHHQWQSYSVWFLPPKYDNRCNLHKKIITENYYRKTLICLQFYCLFTLWRLLLTTFTF